MFRKLEARKAETMSGCNWTIRMCAHSLFKKANSYTTRVGTSSIHDRSPFDKVSAHDSRLNLPDFSAAAPNS
jgi:hypothetical protein